MVENLALSDLHDDEDVEGAECGGDHHEEVAGHHNLGMVADKGQPALFWGPASAVDRLYAGTCPRCAGKPEWSA